MDTPKKKVDLKIQGMTCAMCVQTIENSLNSLDDEISAQVNLGTETASIEYNPEKISIKDLENSVKDAGYEVMNERVTIKIGDMTCAMCVQTIENALNGLEGVIDVHVNLGAEKAYVIYNPKVTSISELEKSIEDTGYRFLGVEGEDTEDI